MPRTVRGERTNNLIVDDDGDGPPTQDGQIRHDGGDLKGHFGGSVVSLISGTGLNAGSHQALLQLIHFIDQGPAKGFVSGATSATTYSGAFPVEVLWTRQDGNDLLRKTMTYTGAFPTTIDWKMYAADGTTIVEQVTDTIVYTGAFETSRTRVIA